MTHDFLCVTQVLSFMTYIFEKANQNIYKSITNTGRLFRGCLRGFFEKKMDYNGFHGYGYGVDDLIVTIDDLINYDPSTIQQEVEQIPDFFDQFAKQFDKDFVVYSRCAHYKMVFVQILNKLITQDNVSKIVANVDFFSLLINFRGIHNSHDKLYPTSANSDEYRKLKKAILELAIKLHTFNSNVLNIIQSQNNVTEFVELCMPFIGTSNGSEFVARVNNFYNELTRLDSSAISLVAASSNSSLTAGNPDIRGA